MDVILLSKKEVIGSIDHIVPVGTTFEIPNLGLASVKFIAYVKGILTSYYVEIQK